MDLAGWLPVCGGSIRGHDKSGFSAHVLPSKPPATPPTRTGPNPTDDTVKHQGLSGAAIAGIVVGVTVFVMIVAVLVYWGIKRRHIQTIQSHRAR